MYADLYLDEENKNLINMCHESVTFVATELKVKND